jgi:hypothetical protein
MVDRENKIPAEAEKIAEDPERVTTIGAKRYLALNDRVIEEIKELDPEVMSLLFRLNREFNDINPAKDMLTAISQLDTNALLLDRAETHLPSTNETKEHLKGLLNMSVIVQFNSHLVGMLRDAVKDHVDPDDTEAACEFLQKNPRIASDFARSSLQAALDQAGDDKRHTPEIEELIMKSMAATLLSGHQPTYAQMSRRASDAHKPLFNKEKVDIHNALVTNPERLLNLVAARGEDGPTLVDTFRFSDVLSALKVVTDPKTNDWKAVRHYRQHILTYAREVAFNPQVHTVFQTARSNADAAREETKKAIPEALSEAIELDWEPFPEEELGEYARDIVQTKNESEGRERKPATVDLRRLEILKQVREWWGVERSEYRRGVRKTRKHKAETEEGEEYFDEYIILVLKHLDDEGNVVREDAVADSPITGRNALYIQRQDVNDWKWDELLRYRKDDVKGMGARDIRHVAPTGTDMVEDMVNKVTLLLTCPEEEFLEARFNRTPEGKPRLRIPKRVMDIVLKEGLDASTQTDHQTRPDDGDGDL